MHSVIGKFCSISWGVTIGAGEHDYNKLTTHDFLYNRNCDLNNGQESYDRFEKKLSIGNDVWIGANSTIIRGVVISNGAIIGANSVVTKDVPAYAIVAGCPAKLVKFRFPKDIILRLEKLNWWDLPPEIIKNKFESFASNDIESAIDSLELEKKI
ncbi:CatB-related O-acetyltransferase [Pseudoalteromonas sp. SWXJZ94C]|nr:CatB-related O-acetyltransferase [Pseudoalteromonas sp. SWXJZ94C]